MSETGSFTEPKDWSGSSSLPPDAASPALGLQVPSIGITGMFIGYCTWVLGTKLRSLHCAVSSSLTKLSPPLPLPPPSTPRTQSMQSLVFRKYFVKFHVFHLLLQHQISKKTEEKEKLREERKRECVSRQQKFKFPGTERPPG